jgi:hypothetical protein
MSFKKVKVWNDDDREYVELFREEELRIPAHGFIIMSRHDAADFVSKWINPIDPKTGQEKNFKKLRREPILESQENEFKALPNGWCPICKKDCHTQLALTNHMRKQHPGLIPVEEKDDTGGTGITSPE